MSNLLIVIIAQAQWDTFLKIVPILGGPGAMMAVFLYALHKKWVMLGREGEALNDRLGEMRKDRDFWRDEALLNNHQADRATDVAHAAAEMLKDGK